MESFEKTLNIIIANQLVNKRKAGNGYFLIPKANPMACDVKKEVRKIIGR